MRLLAAALASLSADGLRRCRRQRASRQLWTTLYGQLDQASKGYETALQQARAGDLKASQLTLTRSLDQLKVAAARCGNTPGCDPQRFFSVFDHLLRLKDGSFSGDEGDTLPDTPRRAWPARQFAVVKACRRRSAA